MGKQFKTLGQQVGKRLGHSMVIRTGDYPTVDALMEAYHKRRIVLNEPARQMVRKTLIALDTHSLTTVMFVSNADLRYGSGSLIKDTYNRAVLYKLSPSVHETALLFPLQYGGVLPPTGVVLATAPIPCAGGACLFRVFDVDGVRYLTGEPGGVNQFFDGATRFMFAQQLKKK